MNSGRIPSQMSWNLTLISIDAGTKTMQNACSNPEYAQNYVFH